MSKKPSLFEAVREFLGPIMAGCCRIIDEGNPDMRVIVQIGGYPVEMTLEAIKKLDRAYAAEFERREKVANRKAKQDDLIARIRAAKAMA